MIFYNVYTGLTGFLLYWLSAYARLPEEIMEAGRIDGLTDLGEFWYIAVPLILPFYATMALLSVTDILDAGGAALLLTGGAYGTYDIGFYLYKYTVSGTLNDQGISGAVGLIKGAIVLPVALIINRFVNKIETVEY
jgi:ABC-type sugar transport system permease subunit